MSPHERQKRGPGFGPDGCTSTCVVQRRNFKTFMLAEPELGCTTARRRNETILSGFASLCSSTQMLKIQQAKRRKRMSKIPLGARRKEPARCGEALAKQRKQVGRGGFILSGSSQPPRGFRTHGPGVPAVLFPGLRGYCPTLLGAW